MLGIVLSKHMFCLESTALLLPASENDLLISNYRNCYNDGGYHARDHTGSGACAERRLQKGVRRGREHRREGSDGVAHADYAGKQYVLAVIGLFAEVYADSKGEGVRADAHAAKAEHKADEKQRDGHMLCRDKLGNAVCNNLSRAGVDHHAAQQAAGHECQQI